MSNEDYVRKFIHLLGSKRSQTELTREGLRLLEHIKEDIENLREQDDLIRRVIMQRGAPPANLRTTRPSNTPTDLSQRQIIRQTAIELAKGSPSGEVDVQSITNRLEDKGVRLAVKKPNSVVGSIVRSTKGFTKIGGGNYRYTEIP